MALADKRLGRLMMSCVVILLTMIFVGCSSAGALNTTLEYDNRYGDWGVTIDKCVFQNESFTFTLMGIFGGSAEDEDARWYDREYGE